MTREEFKSLVNDEVTSDCALPFTVPDKTINRVIDKTAIPWFYRNYEHALEERYLVIEKGWEEKPLFKFDRSIKLPDCIFSVYHVRKDGGTSLFGTANRDFSYEKFIVQQSTSGGVSSMGTGPEDLTYTIFQLMYLDTVEQVLHQSIAFDFNHLTHKLVIKGEARLNPLVLNVGKKVEPEALFDDEYFLKFVVGEVKRNLGRALGTVKTPLIGGIEVDFDAIKDEGKEEVDEVKEDIQNDEGVDYFFMSPQ